MGLPIHEKPLTERDVIIKHTQKWFSVSNWNVESFALQLLFPELERHLLVEPKAEITTSDLTRNKAAKVRRVRRILEGEVHFPFDWKWLWIECLAVEFKESCRKDLMAMAGSMYVPLPKSGTERGAVPSRLSKLMAEFAQMVAASAPAQDGYLDARDDPAQAKRYANEIVDVLCAAFEELAAVNEGTGVQSDPHILLTVSKLFKAEG